MEITETFENGPLAKGDSSSISAATKARSFSLKQVASTFSLAKILFSFFTKT